MITNNNITVSVLLTVFNTDFEFVKRAIQSVLNQDYSNFELIIIDDGSETDLCSQIVDYIDHEPANIIYLRHKNRGQSQSINRGIQNSQGTFIAILDGDDEYKTNHLSTCLKSMKDLDLIASTTETVVDHNNDYFVPDKMNNATLVHVDDCILFATLFGKKEVFQKVGFAHKYAADADFFEQAAVLFRVEKLDLRTYVYYRNNPNSICSVLKRNTQLLST